MRITITGGLGFLGSFTAEAYRDQGHQVTIVDDRSASVVGSIPGTDLHVGDAGDINVLTSTRPDLIVHCASPVGAVAVMRRPGRLASEIMRTTAAVVELARQTGAPLINISTSEVYGFSGVYSEADPCVVPVKRNARLEYAIGKLAAEFTVANSPIQSVTLRPFNMAGPRQSQIKGFVVPTFIDQARRGAPLTVFAGGEQQRAFTAVWDVADFITGLDRFDGSVLNVGNPANRTSITDLAALVKRTLDSPSEIVLVDGKSVHGPDYEEAEGFVKLPDITAARAWGFDPRTGLTELVERSIMDRLAVPA